MNKKLIGLSIILFLLSSLLGFINNVYADSVIIDSYSESNQDDLDALKDNHPSDSGYHSANGQCFTNGDSEMRITSVMFYLYKGGSPTGSAHATLYEMTGTYGSDGKPTGSALAVSDAFDVSALGDSLQLEEFTFSGDNQYVMDADTYYCIVFENPSSGIDTSNYILFGTDENSPSHDGNYFIFFNGVWFSYSTKDAIFYVYGEVTESDSEPFYSNIGDNSVTQVGEDVTVSCYWEDDFELNWTIVSHNSTGDYQNFTVSCSGNASWSNKTFQLNYTSNIKVGYLFYGQDNASQWNSTSYYYITTTPLYIVFNHNNSTQGRFYVDLVYTANETENSYDYNETIFLLSATYNSSYVWCNFTYGETTVTENFYDYQTDGNRTLWCNFDVCNATGNGNGGYTETDLHEYFVLGAVISVFVSVIVMLIVIDKKDLIRGK